MRFVAGVDGGGTRTRALILDEEGHERGYGRGPPGIAGTADPEAVADAVEEAVSAAIRESGAALPLARLCAGLAGAGSDEVRRAVRGALEGRSLAGSVSVTTDVDVALRDAFPDGEPGILLVSGTGSMALGRTADGEMGRAGGWGELLDDAGSGYRIGLDALRAVLRSHDGRGSDTELTRPMLSAMGVARPEDLVGEVHRASKARIAGIAPRVVAVAEDGDPIAGGIVDEAVGELIALVQAVADRLPPTPPEPSGRPARPPVALHGGLVAPDRPLRHYLRAGLESAGFRVLDRAVVGARGAGRLALASLAGDGPR